MCLHVHEFTLEMKLTFIRISAQVKHSKYSFISPRVELNLYNSVLVPCSGALVVWASQVAVPVAVSIYSGSWIHCLDSSCE